MYDICETFTVGGKKNVRHLQLASMQLYLLFVEIWSYLSFNKISIACSSGLLLMRLLHKVLQHHYGRL